MRLKSILIVALFILLLTGSVFAEEAHKLAASQDNSEMNEGIKVHGYWKLEVFDPDGTPVKSVEFTNSLVDPGRLVTLIAGGGPSGGMFVAFDGSPVSPCDGHVCRILEDGMFIYDTPDSKNLQSRNLGANDETLRLTGSVAVDVTTNIDTVYTHILTCFDDKTPVECRTAPGNIRPLTSKTLSPAVPVTAGQIVQITVDITFN